MMIIFMITHISYNVKYQQIQLYGFRRKNYEIRHYEWASVKSQSAIHTMSERESSC